MHSSQLIAIATFLTGTLAQNLDFTAFPGVDQTIIAPVNPAFTAKYAISAITDALRKVPVAQSAAPNCPAGLSATACDWPCNTCTKSTDVLDCSIPNTWGITYDDGPSEFTPALLDELDKRNVKVTFCVVGGKVKENPATLLRAFKAGHQICLHTWSHWALTSMSAEQMVTELEWTRLIVEQVTGQSPVYFRPPYGEIDDRVRAVATAMGLKPLLWNQDTLDWQTLATTPIVSQFTTWANAMGNTRGIVSLEHDLYKETAAIAPLGLDYLIGRGIKVTTAAACNNDPTPYKDTTFRPLDPLAPTNTTTSTKSTSGAAATDVAGKTTNKNNADSSVRQLSVVTAVIGFVSLAYYLS